ncbi:MAG: alpha/beta hydrolase [Acidimicrobiales bacterium]
MPIGHDPAADPALTCTTPDGIDLAVYDFGGAGVDLLLVHATGFCAGVLLPLARALGDRFHCWALDLRGHGRSGRPADGDFAWSGFCTDVLTTADHLGLVRPVGFGHSCGGATLLLAEQARPDTFRSLYLYEPVVIPDWFVPPAPGRNPLTEGARRRRETFPSAEDAFANFSSKPPFGDLDPDVLLRYVEDGFEPVPADEGGDGMEIRLRCRRDDEAEVYLHGFGNGVFPRLHEVQCPVTLGYGIETDAFGPDLMAADAARLPHGSLEPYDGLGHFGPLQSPDEVASRVRVALAHPDGTPGS